MKNFLQKITIIFICLFIAGTVAAQAAQISSFDSPQASGASEPLSFYHTYKTQIWMVAIAIAVIAAVILILSANILYRRQAGKAVKESDELYRSLADVLPQNMYRADKNGRIIYANKAYLSGLEVTADECLGKTHYDFFSQEMADKYTAEDNTVMQTGQILDTFASYRVPATGEMMYVRALKIPIRNSKGDICGIQGIFWDVTKQKHVEAELTRQVEKLAQTQESLFNIMDDTERAKNELEELNKELKAEIEQRERAETALRDSEQRYALAQRTANIGTWESNLETGQITWAGQIHKIFGLEPEQFEGTNKAYRELVHPDDLQYIDDAVKFCLETPDKTYDIEHRIIWPDGTLRWVSQVADVFRDEDDKPVRMVGITMDITKRKDAEQKLGQTVTELKRSNADLQQFAHVASHDLQEPLRMITSYMQLLVNRYSDKLDADAKEFIDFAADGAKRMQGLIKDLLCYSRVGSHGKPFGSCDGAEIVTKSIRDLSRLIEENNVEVTHAPMPMLMADEGQIEQLFRNLITNAIRYRSEDRPAEIHIGCEEKGDEWEFFVRDNGVGIEPQYFKRIFIIFQQLQAKSEYGGSGIGLSLCKRIVERHDGKIWVESEPQKGSTFYFTIPQKKHFIRPFEKIEQPTTGKSV